MSMTMGGSRVRVIVGFEPPRGTYIGLGGIAARSGRRRVSRAAKWGGVVLFPLAIVLLPLLAACADSTTGHFQSQAISSPRPSAASVVAHWVGSCVYVPSSGSPQNSQITLDLTQDGTFVSTLNGSVTVGSYVFARPDHMQVTSTTTGGTGTTDYTVSVTVSRLQLSHHDANGRND